MDGFNPRGLLRGTYYYFGRSSCQAGGSSRGEKAVTRALVAASATRSANAESTGHKAIRNLELYTPLIGLRSRRSLVRIQSGVPSNPFPGAPLGGRRIFSGPLPLKVGQEMPGAALDG